MFCCPTCNISFHLYNQLLNFSFSAVVDDLCGQDRYLSALNLLNDACINSTNHLYSIFKGIYTAIIFNLTNQSNSIINTANFIANYTNNSIIEIFNIASINTATHLFTSFTASINNNIFNSIYTSIITNIINPANYYTFNSIINSTISNTSSIFTSFISSSINSTSYYLCLFSSYLLLSLYSTISLYVYSFDVIHSFGYHSFGFKSDAIPGRVNLVSSLSLLFNGYFISYCYELCGISHSSMLSSVVIL
jgi:hypothetical protein